MGLLKNQNATLCAYQDNYNNPNILSVNTLSFWDGKMSGASDLGNPDYTSWERATRNHLNNAGKSRNLVMWSWCGQVSSASYANIEQYLTLMSNLEKDYPDVTFVYMTGHLDGTGTAGNLYQRNNQIREFCRVNNKTLFDFADIESYDPEGNYYSSETDACNWCKQWCDSHDCDFCTSGCAHSQCFNCYNKGKAFWYMMARLAGWEA
jgi:hypothetical protein